MPGSCQKVAEQALHAFLPAWHCVRGRTRLGQVQAKLPWCADGLNERLSVYLALDSLMTKKMALLRTLIGLMLQGDRALKMKSIQALSYELIAMACVLVSPLLLKRFLDNLALSEAQPGYLAALILLFVFSWTGGAIATAMKMTITSQICVRLGSLLLDRSLKGQLISVARGDVPTSALLGPFEKLEQSLHVVVEGVLWQIMPLGFQMLLAVTILWMAVPIQYALITGFLIVGLAFLSIASARRFDGHAAGIFAAAIRLSRVATDVMRNARRIVLNGNINAERDAIQHYANERAYLASAGGWFLARRTIFQQMLVGVGLVCLMWLAAADMQRGQLTLGGVVLMQAYLVQAVAPINLAAFSWSQSALSLETVGAVLNFARAPSEGEGASLPDRHGPAALRIETLSFSYGEGLPGLEDIDLMIEPGEFVAIIGPNGSGKSTLAQLICGLAEPDAGRILVGQTEMSSVRFEERHRLVHHVPQMTMLLDRSLRENGLYPPTAIDQHELVSLLSAWRFDEEARRLDLDRHAGEQGLCLSGGQMQKLELARISAVGAPIILLDESTSALDSKSEYQIITYLREKYREKSTFIIITHSQDLADLADRIIFLADGKLVTNGSHRELMIHNDEYRGHWKK